MVLLDFIIGKKNSPAGQNSPAGLQESSNKKQFLNSISDTLVAVKGGVSQQRDENQKQQPKYYFSTPSFLPTLMKAAMHLSRCSCS